ILGVLRVTVCSTSLNSSLSISTSCKPPKPLKNSVGLRIFSELIGVLRNAPSSLVAQSYGDSALNKPLCRVVLTRLGAALAGGEGTFRAPLQPGEEGLHSILIPSTRVTPSLWRTVAASESP